MKTLPILLGIKRTSNVVTVLTIISVVTIGYYLYNNILANNLFIATIYAIIFIIAPLIFCSVQMWNSKTKKDFHLVSVILKWILFLGIVSITVINYNILQNVTR